MVSPHLFSCCPPPCDLWMSNAEVFVLFFLFLVCFFYQSVGRCWDSFLRSNRPQHFCGFWAFERKDRKLCCECIPHSIFASPPLLYMPVHFCSCKATICSLSCTLPTSPLPRCVHFPELCIREVHVSLLQYKKETDISNKLSYIQDLLVCKCCVSVV